jgi:hypothetical protein
VTDYWRVRIDWHSELECAQKWGLADSGSFPPAADENRYSLVDTWREAVAKQLLTPAPDGAAVAWKRAKLESRDFSHLPIKAPRVEQAIADDLAFLAAHPTRRSRATTLPMDDQQALTTMVRELLREELDETPPSVA